MKNRIVDLVFACVVATHAFGCAASHRVAVRAEHTLEAGSAAWDDHTDHIIAVCRAKNLATQDERRACVDESFTLDKDVVKPAIVAAVLALRAYWIGVAMDEPPRELKLYLRNFAEAVKDLPPEFFAGLQKIVK
jgi:hypothetical protein